MANLTVQFSILRGRNVEYVPMTEAPADAPEYAKNLTAFAAPADAAAAVAFVQSARTAFGWTGDVKQTVVEGSDRVRVTAWPEPSGDSVADLTADLARFGK